MYLVYSIYCKYLIPTLTRMKNIFSKENNASDKMTDIGNLRPFMKNLSLQCIVIQSGDDIKFTKDGHEIYSFVVADNTGAIELLLWDEIGRCINVGDILRFSLAYVTLYKDMLRLYVSKFGTVKKVSEFNMIFSETPNMSMIKWTPDPKNPQSMMPLSHSTTSLVKLS